ncbi:hypothetical protein H2198_001782 [Neophaeococcomyces mojaviensis]|uniref:Uncharacterized protein n=1 Tax=Neophaeococcomyces mojaviensis TaxID=3383035 RepID=A0ACC3AG59_9EURO|nr:hypothetical protein H2198_001782 [Knufia sp. JES_112]
MDVFSIRRGALRLLASSSIPTVARPRSVRSFASISGRTKPASLSVPFQRRWATTGIEAEGKKEEVPISEIQPTPQEEVENAISEQNAATELDGTPASTDSTASPVGANEDAVTASQEQSSVEKAVDAASTAAGGMPAFNAGGASAEFSSSPRPPREAPKPKPTIYIGNLFFDVTENDLNKEFSRFGTIQNTRLIRDARGLSKGFAYLTFENTEQAQAAVNDLNQQLFEGRRLLVAFAHQTEASQRTEYQERRNKVQNPPSKTLFIGNMSFEMTDRDLNNLFRGIRNVIDVRVAIDRRTGQPRGFAHADFVDVKSAMEAMKVLEGKETYGRKIRVDYSFGPSTAPKNTPR